MSQMGQYLSGSTGGIVSTLTGNVGGPVPPTANNINVVGDGTIVLVTGNPGTSTLTITVDDSVPTAFTTDSGTASPVLNNLNILGGFNITTTGAGDTVTIDVSGTTDHAVQVGNGVGALNSLALGTAGQVLTSNGAGSDPSFQDASLVIYTNVNTTPYVVTATDYYLSVDASGGVITVQLPNAPTNFRTFIVKDRTGSAGANNITVTTVGGAVNIDGATTFVMNTNYESINLLFNGTTYEIY